LILFGGLLLWCLGLQAERYRIPLFVTSATGVAPQGVLRVINRSEVSGTVVLHAIDDAGMRSGPVTFTLGEWAVVEFDASDLANGNAMKGLSGSLGSSVSDRRLEIETDLDIEPLAFVRSADGGLAVMHDTVRGTADVGQSRYKVPIFNPASNVTQASRLRLINLSDAVAAVTISARDDTGASATGGDVHLSIPANGARTLTAPQLETGDTTINGRLGAGVDRWTLSVSADQPILVVNVAVTPTGHWQNLSTSVAPGPAPDDHAAFAERVDGFDVVLETDDGHIRFTSQAGDRYTDTRQVDDLLFNLAGRYRYAGVGADSGRLILMYDSGEECRANLYFTTRVTGWFASRCTTNNDPDGYWLAGTWFVSDGVDTSLDLGGAALADLRYRTGSAIETLKLPAASGGDGTLTYGLSPDVPGLRFDPATLELSGTPIAAGGYAMTYIVTDSDGDTDTRTFTITVVASDAVADGSCYVGLVLGMGEMCTYPDTDDAFSVNQRGRGSFLTYLAGIRIRVDNVAVDGRVYDFAASHQGDGVWRIERIAGSTEPPTADTVPSFGTAAGPGDQTYTVGTEIDALSLPAASGGDGDLNYSLSPDVPGLIFDGETRRLSGTPSATGIHAMTYTVTDSDGDTDALTFTITVASSDEGDTGTEGELYRGVRVAPENRCSVYDSGDYSYPQSVEDQIVAGIGKIYGPYSGQCFDTTRETDIEHIVARSEAHDSGMCAASAATKRAFARDLLNLTLASSSINRFQKSDKDVAEWLPSLNACWFVARTLEVRSKYGLTIDRREADAAERVLSMCASTDMVVRDCDTQPQRPLALVLYDDNGDGRITCAEARAHGIAPVHRGHIAYPYMDDRDNDGVVCE